MLKLTRSLSRLQLFVASIDSPAQQTGLCYETVKVWDFLITFADSLEVNGVEIAGTSLTLSPYIPLGTIKAICQNSMPVLA